jgi:hypothetical protein
MADMHISTNIRNKGSFDDSFLFCRWNLKSQVSYFDQLYSNWFNSWKLKNEPINVFYLDKIGICSKCFSVLTHIKSQTNNEKCFKFIWDIKQNRPYFFETDLKKAKEAHDLFEGLLKFKTPFTTSDEHYLPFCQLANKRFEEMRDDFLGYSFIKSEIYKPIIPQSKPINSNPGIYCLSANGFVKIGMSKTNVKSRANSQLIPSMNLEWVLPTENPYELEKFAHNYLGKIGKRHKKTEWFEYSGSTNKIKQALKQATLS